MLHATNTLISLDLGFEGAHSASNSIIWLLKPKGVTESKDSCMWPTRQFFPHQQSLQENIHSMGNKIPKIRIFL